MKPIPIELIEQIPGYVEPTRESCQLVADRSLLVLFLMANELDDPPEFPPIISNGVEVWPLPAPWTSDEESKVRLLLNLNGRPNDPGLIQHVKRNAEEYNEAIETQNIPLAEKIAAQGADDSAGVWNDTNGLAIATSTDDIFRTLVLSDETKHAFGWITESHP